MLTIIKSLKINTIRITSYDNKNEQFTKKKKKKYLNKKKKKKKVFN